MQGSRRVLEEPFGASRPVRSLSRRASSRTIRRRRKTQNRRFRRLLVADVVGLAIAAFLGPMLAWAAGNTPTSAVSRSSRIYLFDLIAIPIFVGVLRCMAPTEG